jgi:hypothetical protein
MIGDLNWRIAVAKAARTDLENGVFVVDLSGLQLPAKVLKEIDSDIGKAVEKRLAALKLFGKNDLLFLSPPALGGKQIRLKPGIRPKADVG